MFGDDAPCGIVVPEDEDCALLTPWFMFDVAFVLLELWFALTALEVELLPVDEPLVPVLTPGLMFAPALTPELAMPTLAFTPTFGFTCVLDHHPVVACTSPFKLKLHKRGRHQLVIGAFDPSGNYDATPATYSWKIKKKGHGHKKPHHHH